LRLQHACNFCIAFWTKIPCKKKKKKKKKKSEIETHGQSRVMAEWDSFERSFDSPDDRRRHRRRGDSADPRGLSGEWDSPSGMFFDSPGGVGGPAWGFAPPMLRQPQQLIQQQHQQHQQQQQQRQQQQQQQQQYQQQPFTPFAPRGQVRANSYF
jgi:hypothetical protein